MEASRECSLFPIAVGGTEAAAIRSWVIRERAARTIEIGLGYVRPGGIVFLDDHHLPGVARAASFFRANLGWEVQEISTAEYRPIGRSCGPARHPIRGPFDYFADF